MPTYTFPAVIALDEPSGGIARNADGQLYEITDTAFTNPLASITDLAGVPLTTLRSSSQGVVPGFRVTASQPRVMWKSGPYIIEMLSHEGLVADVTAAQSSAADSAASAQRAAEGAAAAAGLVNAPADNVIAAAINNPGSQTRAALDALDVGGGGGGISDPGVPIIRKRADGGTGPWEAANRDIPERVIIWFGAEPASSEQQPGDIRWDVV